MLGGVGMVADTMDSLCLQMPVVTLVVYLCKNVFGNFWLGILFSGKKYVFHLKFP